MNRKTIKKKVMNRKTIKKKRKKMKEEEEVGRRRRIIKMVVRKIEGERYGIINEEPKKKYSTFKSRGYWGVTKTSALRNSFREKGTISGDPDFFESRMVK